MCVADLALSKLKVPLKVDTYAQEAELEAKVAALSATHDEEAMRTALDTVPAASVPFAGELVKLLKAHLGEPGGREPACERCQGTGTTSTGYHCGCASSRTWQRRGVVEV
ncbi:MAG TPA: hypothetical protein VIR30_02705 [Nocardioides sp.]